MKILHTLQRHAKQLGMVTEFIGVHIKTTTDPDFAGFKYICIVIDGPESVNREASWASSFSDEDTFKILQALAEQTRP